MSTPSATDIFDHIDSQLPEDDQEAIDVIDELIDLLKNRKSNLTP